MNMKRILFFILTMFLVPIITFAETEIDCEKNYLGKCKIKNMSCSYETKTHTGFNPLIISIQDDKIVANNKLFLTSNLYLGNFYVQDSVEAACPPQIYSYQEGAYFYPSLTQKSEIVGIATPIEFNILDSFSPKVEYYEKSSDTNSKEIIRNCLFTRIESKLNDDGRSSKMPINFNYIEYVDDTYKIINTDSNESIDLDKRIDCNIKYNSRDASLYLEVVNIYGNRISSVKVVDKCSVADDGCVAYYFQNEKHQTGDKVDGSNDNIGIMVPAEHIVITPPTQSNFDYDRPCDEVDVLKAMKIIGRIVQIARIVVPLLIIVFGMIDYSKAVISDDELAVSKATSSLVKRLIAGILVFLAPPLINGLLKVVGVIDTDVDKGSYGKCVNCILDVNNCGEAIANHVMCSYKVSDTVLNIELWKDQNNNIQNSVTVKSDLIPLITKEYSVDDFKTKNGSLKCVDKIYASIKEEAAETLTVVVNTTKTSDSFKEGNLLSKKEYNEAKKTQSKENQSTETNSGNSSKGISNATLTPIVTDENGVETQRPLKIGECMNTDCKCPNYQDLGGFQFKMATATGRDFSEHTQGERFVSVSIPWNNQSVLVHQKYQNNFTKAFNKIQELKSKGRIGEITDIGTLTIRLNSQRNICSLHAYGVAVDINTTKTISVNGTIYRPYVYDYNSKEPYNNFIKALGREDDSRNEIYTIWKEAFEPNGFTWGGLWTDQNDPGHFEIKF